MTFHLGWNEPNGPFHIGWLPAVEDQSVPLGNLSTGLDHWEKYWRDLQAARNATGRRKKRLTRKLNEHVRASSPPVADAEVIELATAQAAATYERQGLDENTAILAALSEIRDWVEQTGAILDQEAQIALQDDEDAIIAIMLAAL